MASKDNGLQNYYDPKTQKLLRDYQLDEFGRPVIGMPSVSVPAMQPFGFIPEGPTPLDAAIQARNLATGAYNVRQKPLLPEPLNTIMDYLSAPVAAGLQGATNWLFPGLINPVQPKSKPFSTPYDDAMYQMQVREKLNESIRRARQEEK